MAFDGFVISNLVYELGSLLTGGRINKIAQPESDELLLTIKTPEKGQQRLFISASASLPLMYLTGHNKTSPLTAPNFCMLLRKHLNSARILSITQPGLERIIEFKIEHLDEMGDTRIKYLIVELMGKHSNIIFCDEEKTILDSIKHISAMVSSVREVLPGRSYFIPNTTQKKDPLLLAPEQREEFFQNEVLKKPLSISKAIYTSFTGISPLLANEVCFRASIDADAATASLSETEGIHLYHTFALLLDEISTHAYVPAVILKTETKSPGIQLLEPVCFSSTHLSSQLVPVEGCQLTEKKYTSISLLLEDFYAAKNQFTRIRQKSADLRKIVNTALERCCKKRDLQEKQLKDTEKRDKYRIYGELLNTYGYSLKGGEKEFSCNNYYTNEEITIPLDPTLTAMENSKHFFEKYNKLKRTFEAGTVQLAQTLEEIEHLESIQSALDIAREKEDLVELKEELIESGYIRRHLSGKHSNPNQANKKRGKKEKVTSKPFHYISSDGFDIYVGKNNFQNDALTFQFASGNDWWFHAKKIPGSHVLLKANGQEIPDRAFEEAGMLAAYYSKARDMAKVEIDYIEKKHVKKPNGAKPGFVIYHTNYSLVASPDISHLKEVP